MMAYHYGAHLADWIALMGACALLALSHRVTR